MANSNDLLNVARGEIGYCRYDDPQAGTKYGRWYADLVGNSYYGQSGVAFCAMFVSWCLSQCDLSAVGFPSAYCPDIVNAAKRAGVNKSASQGQAGDIVLFDWEGDGVSDHVGIVESNSGGYLTCIEGNTTGSDGRSGSVARRTRAYSTVVLTFTPNYYEQPKEWDEMATYDEVKDAAKQAAIEALEERMQDLLLNAQYKGHATKDLWQYASYDTSDPTGRGKELTTHDHVKYIAANQTDTSDPTGRGMECTDHDHIKWIAAVEKECQAMLETICDILLIIAKEVVTKDDIVSDVEEKTEEVKELSAKFDC